MTTVTFSSLPAEVHASIAQNCQKNDLISLCLTSKWVNEICLPVLYRHVDLETESNDYGNEKDLKSRQQLVRTLLSRPEYGKHIRVLKVSLCTPDYRFYPSIRQDRILDTMLWHAMQSLTHVRSVEIGTSNLDFCSLSKPKAYVQSDLFPSVTSVALVGRMHYCLAKMVLNSINPAKLRHLCLDLVRDNTIGYFSPGIMPGDRGEDGQILARGATGGLLTTITGRYTTLQTLVLRRFGQVNHPDRRYHDAAEDASYTEWAAFICSVQGTIRKLRFEQIDQESGRNGNKITDVAPLPFRTMDERFERLIFPTIVSGSWPQLTTIELRGVRGSIGRGGTTGLTTQLKTLHGEDTCIVVEEITHFGRAKSVQFSLMES